MPVLQRYLESFTSMEFLQTGDLCGAVGCNVIGRLAIQFASRTTRTTILIIKNVTRHKE
jgi:hypothetical protein